MSERKTVAASTYLDFFLFFFFFKFPTPIPIPIPCSCCFSFGSLLFYFPVLTGIIIAIVYGCWCCSPNLTAHLNQSRPTSSILDIHPPERERERKQTSHSFINAPFSMRELLWFLGFLCGDVDIRQWKLDRRGRLEPSAKWRVLRSWKFLKKLMQVSDF